MQAFSRGAASLWSAWSSASRVAARSFSAAAAEGTAAAGPVAAEAAEGAKAKLISILRGTTEPMTSAQVWAQAEPLGFKSKRFTKQMLHQLKRAGWVNTAQVVHSGKKHKAFGYRLNQAAQQRRAAAPQRRAAAGGA